MRLRPGLKHNLTVLQHAHLCQRLFQLKVDEAGGVERTAKAEKAGGSLFGLPAGVVPLSNNSCQTAIIAMMPDFNAHDLDPTWAEPKAERVQAFFDNLSERYIRDEPLLVRDTTREELAYIAARAEEAALAKEVGSVGTMEDEADTAAEEKEFAEWAGSAGEANGAGAGAPLVEEAVKESAKGETEADDSSAPGREHVLRRASSGEPIRPGGTTQRQQAQAQPVRQTRAAAVKKAAAAASSSSKRCRTPSPSPPLSDGTPEADFDLGSVSPKRRRRPAEEDDDMEMLVQRAAKRAKASTGDKPPASTPRTPVLVEISPDNSPQRSPRFIPQRGEGQQEEPLKAAPDTPPPLTTPPRGASPARAPTAEPMRMEEGEASLGAGGSVPTTNVGGEGTTSSQLGTDPPSTDQEDIDTVIEEVAKDAEAEAAKIVAGEVAKSAPEEAAKIAAWEAAKSTAKEAAKGLAGETGEAAAGEAAPAPGKYLKVGDDLFIHLPGTVSTRALAEGEVFDDEALATAGL
nr:probable E3 ubiquitin-protein ligase IRF2BPL [Aegilops tauschii subsp. strangulata]